MGRRTKPREVSLGGLLTAQGVKTERPRRWGFSKLFPSLLALIPMALVLGVVASLFPLIAISSAVVASEPAFQFWKELPDEMPEVAIAERNVFYDINGKPFATLWSQDRVELDSLDKISDYAKTGLIDTEDKRFYEHNGFDVIGTARAAVSGYGGGSGITQQLVKNLQYYNLLGKEGAQEAATAQTFNRKLRELKTAMRYEDENSKDEILLTYFNTVAFGGPNIYGIETASRFFFGKNAADLSLAEAAALVGSAQNPTLYNMTDPSNTNWKYRQGLVLDRMLDEGHITQAEADEAKESDLEFKMEKSSNGNCYSSSYPLYCQYVLDYLLDSPRLGETEEEREIILARGGLQVKTYLDPEKQDAANQILTEGFGNENPVVAPTAVVQPGTGGVMVVAQNRGWGEDEGETTLVTPTHPAGEGSAYKVFTLAAALNSGMNEADLEFNAPCRLYPGDDYDSPPDGYKNSSNCELQAGNLNYKEATAYSSNTWYVALEMMIGVEAVKEFSKSVDLSAPDYIGPRSLSYTLGVVGNSPVQVAASMATFANEGVYCPPTPLREIHYDDGTIPAIPDSYDPSVHSCRSVISPKDAGTVLKALRANVQGEVERAFGRDADIPGYDTVGKSGTNQLMNSAWAQMSSQYALYTNVYDMEKPTRGIDGAFFRGYPRPWTDNTAQAVGADIMAMLLDGEKNVPLNYSSRNDEYVETPVDNSAFFTVPSVLGMPPEQALEVLQSTGVTAHVSKESRPTPAGYTAGVVVEQSIEAGERLSRGTDKEIILFVGK